MPPSAIRTFRHDHNLPFENESSPAAENVPFLTQEQSFDCGPGLEDGFSKDSTTSGHPDDIKSIKVTCSPDDYDVTCSCCCSQNSPYYLPRRRWSWNPFRRFSRIRRTVAHNDRTSEKGSRSKSRLSTPLRRVLRLLAIALMLL